MIYISRKHQQDLIEKRVHAFLKGYRHNIALIGDDNSGKKSLLTETFSKKFLNTALLPVYIDLYHVDQSTFVQASIFSILHSYFKKTNPDLFASNINELIFRAQESVPAVAEMAKASLAENQSSKRSLESVFGLLDLMISEAKMKPVVIVDDFALFKDYSKRQLAEMTKRIVADKQYMFVFMSSDVVSAEDVLENELNLLFGAFEKMHINSLDQAEADALIRCRLNTKLSRSAQAYLMDTTGNNPYYMNVICDQFKSYSFDSISDELFTHVFADICISNKSVLFTRFMSQIEMIKATGKSDRLIKLMIAVSQGYTRKQELSDTLKCEQKKITADIAVLEEMQVITRVGSFYAFRDRMFCHWVKNVLKTLTYTSYLFYDDLFYNIEQNIVGSFKHFAATTDAPHFDRFMQAVSRFKNDTLPLYDGTYRLPQLSKVSTIPSATNGISYILGESGKSYTMIAFKNGEVDQTDVSDFVERCETLNNRPTRRIIVSLQEADESAKLMAKEQKMTLVNRRHANELMRCYNLPAFV